MKKLLSFLLLFLFLFTNSGMSLTIHWCGGKYSSFSLLPSKKHTCKCGKKPMKAGCCKNTSQVLKLESEFSKVKDLDFRLNITKFIPVNNWNYSQLNQLNPNYYFTSLYHPPPDKPPVPIYIWNNIFLI